MLLARWSGSFLMRIMGNMHLVTSKFFSLIVHCAVSKTKINNIFRTTFCEVKPTNIGPRGVYNIDVHTGHCSYDVRLDPVNYNLCRMV